MGMRFNVQIRSDQRFISQLTKGDQNMDDLIVVKIGGNAISQLKPAFFEKLKYWKHLGKKVLIVHGGGPNISKLCEKMGIPAEKKHGIRVTGKEVLELTKLVLLGESQPELVEKLTEHGLPVSPLSCACSHLLEGKYLDEAKYGSVGTVTKVNKMAIAGALWQRIGVMAPMCVTEDGKWLNVNADSCACSIASLLHAEALYLLTDVAGVMENGQVIPKLDRTYCSELFAKKVITAGMQPKLNAAFTAQAMGVSHVIITDDLDNHGTEIVKEEEDDDAACVSNV